jgi:hypothetical protein
LFNQHVKWGKREGQREWEREWGEKMKNEKTNKSFYSYIFKFITCVTPVCYRFLVDVMQQDGREKVKLLSDSLNLAKGSASKAHMGCSC